MNVATAVCCYNRPKLLGHWLRLWPGLNPSTPLVVANTYDLGVDYGVHAAWLHSPMFGRDSTFVSIPNCGADIAALKYVLSTTYYPFDVLCWFTDDCLPMRRDFLEFYIEPIRDARVGLVAFAFEQATPANANAHARTVAFAIRREAAMQLTWPYNLTSVRPGDRNPCFAFEHGPDNMFQQVCRNGWEVRACQGSTPGGRDFRPWTTQTDLMWDCGHQPELNLWDKFYKAHDL